MNKKFKGLVTLLLVMCSLAPIFAQGASEADDQIVIAGIYKMGDAEWFLQEGEAARKVVEEAGGKFMYMDAGLDGARYMEMLDNAITQQVDGVLTCTPDQNLSRAAVTKLEEAGIPVIACDDALQDENGNRLAPWVGIDAYNIGKNVGEWSVEYINENNLADDPDFAVMLLTADTVSSCVPRTSGQYDTIIAAFPNFDKEGKIFRADHDTTAAKGNEAAATILAGNPQIKKWLVLGVSDDGAQGAARAIEAVGLEENSMCVGLGGYFAPEEFAKESSPFKACAYFSAKDVGGTSAKQMMNFLQNGVEIPEVYAAGAIIVEPADDLNAIMPEYM
ncbi:MAG: substrate-binding domain-containing protein [Sphaerochaetaceae bacterium]|nr:substrate-binding domain-containing protein [Sphaerochaetaceae bacterium]